eukprot:scaffold85021_cov18-Tisochrysis_lutea.AAC.2
MALCHNVNAFGGSGVPHVVNRLLQPIPIVSFGPNFTIFPGKMSSWLPMTVQTWKLDHFKREYVR